MPEHINRSTPAMIRVEKEIGRIMERVGAGRVEQQGMVVALAEVLQRELACDVGSRTYPHASSLEWIMRAVIAALRGGADARQEDYILSKLDTGVGMLKRSFES